MPTDLPRVTENVKGRVENLRLSRSKPLLPLYEAVVNALDAVEEAGCPDGAVTITVRRGNALNPDGNAGGLPVTGLEVSDNGVGFTEANFAAFLTADTDYKKSRGGKGVGRFHWLKAFRSVEVDSTYREAGQWYRRRFTFEPTAEGITTHELTGTRGRQQKTVVRLRDMRSPYVDECPVQLRTIAQHLLEHCLGRLRSDPCPRIAIQDDDDSVSLSQLFRDTVEPSAVTQTLSVDGHELQLSFYKLRRSRTGNHQLHFCAHRREVEVRDLSELVQDLPRTLEDEKGERFTYSVYVSGALLDSLVNEERSAFRFAQEGELGLFPATEKELVEPVLRAVEEHLTSYLKPLRQRKVEQIEQYVREKAPGFRHLVRNRRDLIERIPADLSPQKLEAELAKAEFEVKQGIQKLQDELLRDRYEDPAEYMKQLTAFINKYDEIGKSKLADYVAHRKTILSLMARALERNENGEYRAESIVHSLVFPMRRTSDEIDLEDQNLWVIDERLAYHRYLASDLRLKDMEPIESSSKERPDIAVFNGPIAYTEGEYPYESIVIVEFKKPDRSNYTVDKNPYSQVINYVHRIRDGGAKDAKGRLIPEDARRQYYCYVIADMTPKLREILALNDLRETPDGLGFFRYHTTFNAYCEVLPYDKVLRDAEKRNKVLFDKLNI